MARRIIVIGAGQAGMALVAKLRESGHQGPVTLIGGEAYPPYQRPPLSKKYLLGEMAQERLFLKPQSYFEQNKINLRTDCWVRDIDRENHEIVLDNRRLVYDTLAICTGAHPRHLPASIGGDMLGVHVVRDLDDIDAMAAEFVPGARVLIIGGGYIGLEAAAVAANRGLKVTLIESGPRILNRVAAPETSDFFRALHQSHGVVIHEDTSLVRLRGQEGRADGAILSTGEEIPFDFAIVGIGVNPDTSLAEASGLHVDNGIATDSRGRTSDPAIFAAGDCASFPFNGKRIRLESVQNAIDQAEHVAQVIMGEEKAYTPVPWFWSDQYDTKLQIAGINTGYTRTIVRPGHRPGGQSIWYFRHTSLLAVDAINDPKAYMQAKRWLEAERSPTPDAIADPALELRALA